MKISRQNLIDEGFTENKFQDLFVYTKDKFGIVYNFGMWFLCNCETDIPLNNRTYVSTMEEVLKCYDEYVAMNGN